MDDLGLWFDLAERIDSEQRRVVPIYILAQEHADWKQGPISEPAHVR